MIAAQFYEVSLRDGLQYETQPVATDAKVALVGRLVAAGVRELEVTAFFRARLFPQFADAEALFRALPPLDGVRYWAYVPNEVGLDRAVEAGVNWMSTAYSIGGGQAEGRSAREVRRELQRLIAGAVGQGVGVRLAVSDAFGGSRTGPAARVAEEVAFALDTGAISVVLADGEGHATPALVQRVFAELERQKIDSTRIAVHFHDTQGLASANVLAAWTAGVRSFDGSLAGYSGDPARALGAGVMPTEELIYLLTALGAELNTDWDRVCSAGGFWAEVLGRILPGKIHQHWRAAAARAVWSA